jgi:hypothetical protein
VIVTHHDACTDRGGAHLSVRPSNKVFGHVEVFPPPDLLEPQEEKIELALAGHAAEIFEETGLYILCAVLDPTVR